MNYKERIDGVKADVQTRINNLEYSRIATNDTYYEGQLDAYRMVRDILNDLFKD